MRKFKFQLSHDFSVMEITMKRGSTRKGSMFQLSHDFSVMEMQCMLLA